MSTKRKRQVGVEEPVPETQVADEDEEDVQDDGDDHDDSDDQGSSQVDPKLAAKMKKLAQLKSLRSASLVSNRKDVYAEHQRQKRNPKEEVRSDKKRREAEILQTKLAAEEEGFDYERARSLNYSVESVERYEKEEREKAKRSDLRFTDFAQVAAKKYKKLVKELKPDLARYEEQKNNMDKTLSQTKGDSNATAYAVISNKPAADSVGKLVREVVRQEEKRKAFSRRRAHDEDGDISYINERNMRFNRKVARAYDKYTSEIKASFERGTAL